MGDEENNDRDKDRGKDLNGGVMTMCGCVSMRRLSST